MQSESAESNASPPADRHGMVWPPGVELSEFAGRWWVFHVKPRQEKTLADELRRSDVPHFLPLYEAVRTSKGRKWKSVLPLFPGYIFFCGDETQRIEALKTNRIVRAIDVPDPPRLVEELSAIRRLLKQDMLVHPLKRFRPGDRCRIRSGPLVGLEGTVHREAGKARFVLVVSMLGQGAEIEMDADLLEPVE